MKENPYHPCPLCRRVAKLEGYTIQAGRRRHGKNKVYVIQMCDSCGPYKSLGVGTPNPVTPRSDSVYHGGRFNAGEW